jgi:oxepin-CoA hydrolase/3-oxo-5,6-dehydrosuberyl-CoA semialdehyde dehydrogenase
VEADSLNCAIVGPDVEPGTALFDVLVRDCVTELTQQAGQKCTATRRILVPEGRLEALRDALRDRLSEISTKTGDPADKANRMGPLSTAQQLADARAGVAKLSQSAERIFGDPERKTFEGVDAGQGWFLEPVLLQATAEGALDPKATFHHVEVFGPVATLLPYDGDVVTAAKIVGYGEGSLVSTWYSDDRALTKRAVAELAPHLGRLVLASEKTAGASVAPGCVFPVVVHGGPGRAGGGAELGNRLGMDLYLQRTTIQAGGSQLARLVGA